MVQGWTRQMIIIFKYQRANMPKGYCQVHFFRNGKYIRSSDILPYSDELIGLVTKGHPAFSIVNVMSKADLAYKVINKTDR